MLALSETVGTVEAAQRPQRLLHVVPPPEPLSLDMEEWVAACAPLCHELAWRYRGLDDHEDLFQCASVGVVLAARRYAGDSFREFKVFAWKLAHGEVTKHYFTTVRKPGGGQRHESRSTLLRVALHDFDAQAHNDDGETLDARTAALDALDIVERRIVELRYGLVQPSPAHLRAKSAATLSANGARGRRVAASVAARRAKGHRAYAGLLPFRVIAQIVGEGEPRVHMLHDRALRALKRHDGGVYVPPIPFGGCASLRAREAQCSGCRLVWVRRLSERSADIRREVAGAFRDASRLGRPLHDLSVGERVRT